MLPDRAGGAEVLLNLHPGHQDVLAKGQGVAQMAAEGEGQHLVRELQQCFLAIQKPWIGHVPVACNYPLSGKILRRWILPIALPDNSVNVGRTTVIDDEPDHFRG